MGAWFLSSNAWYGLWGTQGAYAKALFWKRNKKCKINLLYCPDLAEWWWVMMSSYLSKWDSNRRRFEPQSHLNNPWPTSTVPFLRDFPNLRAMPQGLELLADSGADPKLQCSQSQPLAQPHTIHLKQPPRRMGLQCPPRTPALIKGKWKCLNVGQGQWGKFEDALNCRSSSIKDKWKCPNVGRGQ